MPEYVIERTARALNRHGKSLKGSKALVLGLSYKADIDDDRESPSFEIIERLRAEGVEVAYCDPYIPVARPGREHDLRLSSVPCTAEEFARYDVLVVSTAHSDFKRAELLRRGEARRRHPQPDGAPGARPAGRPGPGSLPGVAAMKIFVPGRICLFGEHSDWAGGYRRINAEIEKGYTLICGTNQGIHAEVEPHPTALVLTSTTPDGETHGPYEIPLEPRGAPRGGAAGRLLQLRRRRRLPGADELPRARPRHPQLQDRPADQEGPLLERRDQRAHRPRLQPRLRPAAHGPRRDGARLPGRDHDALALRAHGPGLRLRRPRRADGVRRRPPRDRGDPAGEGPALRDRGPQGEEGHRRDPEAAQPLATRSPRARSRRASRSCSARSTSASSSRRRRPCRRATRSGSAR